MPTAVLSARRDAGGGLLLVALEVDAELARAYTSPGQYIKVTTAGAKGYFVLASPLGETRWEILVKKKAGDAADALETMPLGSAVALDGPLGAGFPAAHVPSRPVVVAVVASALGLARTLIDLRIADGASRATTLLLGVRSPLDVPIAAEIASWSTHGVDVVLCLSRSELHHHVEVLPGVRREVGYVQQAFARAVDAGRIPPGSLVVVAGPDAMVADMREHAKAAATSSGGVLEVVTNV